MPKREDISQFQFSFNPVSTLQGDEAFVIKPGKPVVGRRKVETAAAEAHRASTWIGNFERGKTGSITGS